MFPSHSSLLFFVSAAALLLAIPGPAIFYIVGRSIGHSRNAGLVSALGIGVGTLIHTAAAAVGLSALLVSSAIAFSVVKYLGAALSHLSRHPETPPRRIFRRLSRCTTNHPHSRLRPRHRRQRPQPKDRPLLLRLSPTIYRSIPRTRRHTNPLSRHSLRLYGNVQRQPLGRVLRHGRAPSPRQPALDAHPTLRLRRHAHLARRSHSLRRLLYEEVVSSIFLEANQNSM